MNLCYEVAPGFKWKRVKVGELIWVNMLLRRAWTEKTEIPFEIILKAAIDPKGTTLHWLPAGDERGLTPPRFPGAPMSRKQLLLLREEARKAQARYARESRVASRKHFEQLQALGFFG